MKINKNSKVKHKMSNFKTYSYTIKRNFSKNYHIMNLFIHGDKVFGRDAAYHFLIYRYYLFCERMALCAF